MLSTAMSNKPRHGVLTPGGASRKRKEREVGFDALKAAKATTTTQAAEPAKDNRLLAGYLAHEFLTQGTLFGQKWDPARAEATPISPRNKPNQKSRRAEVMVKAAAAAGSPVVVRHHESYAEVANLLKSDGAHIEGIVNPTQLARWLQM
ncbi:hypothetical protein BVC80_9099g146 [Macleaya cordata]|uniref:Uncharacterized protein n=1 Tax=Macleaya cordata TaxID=56857 RepID=A0A200PVX7_MACCD|nr:hypothetical protein BVC80_9099g146 [Macleaya cordata]